MSIGRAIGKGLAGFAQAAGPVLLERERERLQALRDQRLQEWRQQERAEDKAERAEEIRAARGERAADRALDVAHQDRMFRLNEQQTQAQIEASRATGDRARTEIEEIERLRQVTSDYLKATDPAERERLAQDIMALNGRPLTLAGDANAPDRRSPDKKIVDDMVSDGVFESEAQAWSYIHGMKGSGNAVGIYRALADEQKAQFLRPGDPEYRNPQELFREAQQIYAELSATPQPGASRSSGAAAPAASEPRAFKSEEEIIEAVRRGEISVDEAEAAARRLGLIVDEEDPADKRGPPLSGGSPLMRWANPAQRGEFGVGRSPALDAVAPWRAG